MALKKFKKRFGEIAVEKGFITLDQLQEGLDLQKNNDSKGLEHRLIGSILYRQGYMTMEQVIEVLKKMEN